MKYGYRHILITLLALLSSAVTAGPSLIMGGRVDPAADTTSPDLGSWTVYDVTTSAATASGLIGLYATNYWAGEVGYVIDGITIGDTFAVILEKETGTGTINHTGYHAVVQHTLDNSDPAEFPLTQISLTPTASVSVQSTTSADISWSTAQGGTAIAGYNVYRSDDGINFTQANGATIVGLAFTDAGYDQYVRYYAIGIVYAGIPEQAGSILSANSPDMPDTDGDGLVDDFELAYGGNPGVYDIGLDLDPNLIDTDGDGFNDDVELNDPFGDPLDRQLLPANGDVNEDGIVNIQDLLIAQQIILGQRLIQGNEMLRLDVAPVVGGVTMPDGVLNAGDLVVLSQKVLN